MPILLAGTMEFVHIEHVSALFMFRLGQVLLHLQSKVGPPQMSRCVKYASK
jgi:hypothetical protein